MLKSFRLAVLAVLAGTVLVAAASAEPLNYKFDTNHSVVGFKIRHFFSKVAGRFNEFGGTVVFDDKNLATSSVDVTIQAASIFTNNERRDNDLRSANFFEVEKYPTLAFKSTKVVPGENGKFKLIGNLTMHGVTKPVELDAELVGMGPVSIEGRAMGSRAGFVASATLDRKEFGIIWNRTLDQGGTMLGDDVAIDIEVELVQEMPKGELEAARTEPAKK